MKAARLLLPTLLLAACGDGATGGAPSRAPGDGDARAAFPAFRFHAGDLDIVSVDAAGNVRVGGDARVGGSTVDGRVPALVTLGDVTFGAPSGGPAGRGWFGAPAFRVPGESVAFSSEGAFTCAVGEDLRRLAAALGDGRAADLPPPASVAGAGVDGTSAGCAARRAIRCYLSLWSATPARGRSLAVLRSAAGGGGAEAKAEYAFALAQAAQAAASCAAGNAAARDLPASGPAPAAATFAIEGSALVFSPSPLLSLSIYEGERTDYDDALVRSLPVAFVAVPDDCAVVGGACVASPWPVAKCRRCDKLEKGKTYTAFFVERSGQLHRDIKRVVFRR